MRCPDCGALNPDEAAWCNQCLRRFGPVPTEVVAPAPAQEAAVPTDVVDDPFDLPTAADASPDPPHHPALVPATAVGSQRGPFTVTDGGVVWTCASCGTTNSMDAEICSACGTSLRGMLEPHSDDRPMRDPRLTLLVALSFPGVGHAYLRMWGQAIARASMGLLALAGVAACIDLNVRGSNVMAAILGVVALLLWAVCAHDAYQEARGMGRASILKGRMFLYVDLGILGLLFIQLLIGVAGR